MSDLRVLPFSECTTEVLKDVAKRLLPWCESIIAGTADDAYRTPLTPDVRELFELVRRMAGTAEFYGRLEYVCSKALSRDNAVSNAIIWFVLGWKAADTRLQQKVEEVT